MRVTEGNTPEHHSEGTTLVTPSRELCTHLVGGGFKHALSVVTVKTI